MTHDPLKDLKELEAKATPAPWVQHISHGGEFSGFITNGFGNKSGKQKTLFYAAQGYGHYDNELVCKLRNALPDIIASHSALVAACETAYADLEILRDKLKDIGASAINGRAVARELDEVMSDIGKHLTPAAREGEVNDETR